MVISCLSLYTLQVRSPPTSAQRFTHPTSVTWQRGHTCKCLHPGRTDTLFLWVLPGQNATSAPSLPPGVFHFCSTELYTSQLSKTGKFMQQNITLHKLLNEYRFDEIGFFCFQLRKNILSSHAYRFLFLPYHEYAGYADQSCVYQLDIWKMKTVIFTWSQTGIQ